MKAKNKPSGPYNIELFAGSPDDANAPGLLRRRDEGAQAEDRRRHPEGRLRPDRLQPGRHPGLEGRERAEAHGHPPVGNYATPTLDGVLSPNDTLARAIITSVKAAGKPIPIVTGQDSEVESVKSIMAGEQYSTINKDTRNAGQPDRSRWSRRSRRARTADGQRHQVVQQRCQGRPGLPADPGHRHQGERRGGLRQRPDAPRDRQRGGWTGTAGPST